MSSDMCPTYAPFFSALGCASAIIFSSFGASYGTAKSSIGAFSAGVLRPDLGTYMILPTVFSGVLAIYGLIASIVIANHVRIGMSLYTALINFGTGLAVGLSGLAAGFAVGIVGDAGVRSLAQQPKMFVNMVLILIFAEVLGLYGLIVGLIINTKAKEDGGVCNRF